MAEINLKNIKAYLQGNTRAILRSVFPDSLPDHIEEQFAYRLEKAKDCVAQGRCRHCGCSMPEKLLASDPCPLPAEENPCYGPMLDATEWAKFKQQ